MAHLDVLGSKRLITENAEEALHRTIRRHDELDHLLGPSLLGAGRLVTFTDNLVYGEPVDLPNGLNDLLPRSPSPPTRQPWPRTAS